MNDVQALARSRRKPLLDLPPVSLRSPVIDLRGDSFPPYNIERLDDDLYRIVLGVAGYAADEIAVSEDGIDLVVRGNSRSLASNGEAVRRMIEPRFERRFRLLNGFHLDEWEMRDGLLVIHVARDPAPRVAADLPPERQHNVSAMMAAAAA